MVVQRGQYYEGKTISLARMCSCYVHGDYYCGAHRGIEVLAAVYFSGVHTTQGVHVWKLRTVVVYIIKQFRCEPKDFVETHVRKLCVFFDPGYY